MKWAFSILAFKWITGVRRGLPAWCPQADSLLPGTCSLHRCALGTTPSSLTWWRPITRSTAVTAASWRVWQSSCNPTWSCFLDPSAYLLWIVSSDSWRWHKQVPGRASNAICHWWWMVLPVSLVHLVRWSLEIRVQIRTRKQCWTLSSEVESFQVEDHIRPVQSSGLASPR